MASITVTTSTAAKDDGSVRTTTTTVSEPGDEVVAASGPAPTNTPAGSDDTAPESPVGGGGVTDEFLSADGVVNAGWLSERLKQPVASAKLRDQAKMGGMSGDIKYIDAQLASGDTLALVLKTAAPTPMRKGLGLAREAFFYTELAPGLAAAGVPKAFFAHGDMATGDTVMLLECFEDAVPSGTFFGGGNPNNWCNKGKLEAMCEGNPSAPEITAQHFKLYAQLHARHWNDASLLSNAWLRGAGWLKGDGQATWEGAQAMAAGAWAKVAKQREEGSSAVVWDDHLVKCLDASFAKVSWDAFQTEQAARPYALVHGDAHPHNALWMNQRTEDARLCLIDFEMIGVGSPGQEAGQYLISHATPELRRVHEDALLAGYHEELTTALRQRGMGEDADRHTLADTKAEYIAGGAGRWAWFVPLFVNGFGSPAPVCQYFHDQLAAFLADHVPDPSDSPMPRV